MQVVPSGHPPSVEAALCPSVLPACLVGIEACASSHHWSRELKVLGHTVRLMPPAYVKPYVKRQKNDTADAEAICEAVTRANMRFVATKDARAAELLDAASHPPSVHPSADCGDQCDPGSSGRVRDRRAGRTQGCRGVAQRCYGCKRQTAARGCTDLSRSAGGSTAPAQGTDSGVRPDDRDLAPIAGNEQTARCDPRRRPSASHGPGRQHH